MFKSQSYNLDLAFEKSLNSPKVQSLFGMKKIAQVSFDSTKGIMLNLISASEDLDKLGFEKEAEILLKIANEEPLTDEDYKYFEDAENEILDKRKSDSFYDPDLQDNVPSEDLMDRLERVEKNPDEIPEEHLFYEDIGEWNDGSYDVDFARINPAVHGIATPEDEIELIKQKEEAAKELDEYRKRYDVKWKPETYDEYKKRPLEERLNESLNYLRDRKNYNGGYNDDKDTLWANRLREIDLGKKKAQFESDDFSIRSSDHYEKCGTCNFDHQYDLINPDNIKEAMISHIKAGELHGFNKDDVIEFLERYPGEFSDEEIEKVTEIIEQSLGDHISV